MIATRWPHLLFVLAACACTGAAQDETKPERIDSTTARKLSSVLDDLVPARSDSFKVDNVADAVFSSLAGVNHMALTPLNERLESLQKDEKKLLEMVSDMQNGIPVQMADGDPPGRSLVPVDEPTLEYERSVLIGLETQLSKLRLSRQDQQDVASAREAAQRISPMSNSLLKSLDAIPAPPKAATPVVTVAKKSFPRRLARALFRTEDWVGALKQFESIPAEELTARDRWEMARCLEETEKVDEAIKLLASVSDDVDPFWRGRVKSLRAYLQREREIRKVLDNPKK